MAGIKLLYFDPKRTVVVLNVPSNFRKAELTIHFQKSKYGGGDVNDVVVDGNVAFVTFDSIEGLSKIFVIKYFGFRLKKLGFRFKGTFVKPLQVFIIIVGLRCTRSTT